MQRKLDSFPDSVSEPKSRRESSELEKEETDSGKAGTDYFYLKISEISGKKIFRS